jgi:hypothetical protein
VPFGRGAARLNAQAPAEVKGLLEVRGSKFEVRMKKELAKADTYQKRTSNVELPTLRMKRAIALLSSGRVFLLITD